MAANISNSETCLESMTKLMNADITGKWSEVLTQAILKTSNKDTRTMIQHKNVILPL